MKSLTLVRNAVFKLVESAVPVLEADECLVQVSHAGICASDFPRTFDGGAYHYPLVLGHEFSGTVIELGSSCSTDLLGKRVAVFPLLPCRNCQMCSKSDFVKCKAYGYYGSRTDGGLSELIAVKSWNLFSIPDEISLADAALIEPVSVSVHAISRAQAEIEARLKDGGCHAAIFGAGFLGLVSAAVLRMRFPTLEIDVFDRNAEKEVFLKGLNVGFNVVREEADWESRIGVGNQFDLAFEMTGAPGVLSRAIQLVAPGGSIILVGNPSSDFILKKSVASLILRKELRLEGSWNSSFRPDKGQDDWEESLRLLQSGLLPSSFVSHHSGLEELPDMMSKVWGHKQRSSNFPAVKLLARVRP